MKKVLILMSHIQITIVLLIISSCLRTDYKEKIINNWEIKQFEIEFEGTPDPEANLMLSPFNIGIKINQNGTCQGVENNIVDDSITYYVIEGTFFDGKYELINENLTINNKLNFKIISLNDTELKMDLFLSLEDYNYNLNRLKKLRERGTSENLIIHYSFRKKN